MLSRMIEEKTLKDFIQLQFQNNCSNSIIKFELVNN